MSSSAPATASPRDLSAQPYAEQVVALTRVDGKKVVEERPIKFDTKKRKTDALYEGETKVVEEGKVGIETRTFREVYLDGKLDSRQLVSKVVTEKPVTEVLLVGTKERPDNMPTADGLNWAALAECESGGNPQASTRRVRTTASTSSREHLALASAASGCPTQASASEQTYRAQILYNRSGAGQWPVCGSNLFSSSVPAALLGPAEVRELAARLGLRPTKTLGQNFVIDANTVRRIVRTADVDAGRRRRRGRARPRLADPGAAARGRRGDRRRDRPGARRRAARDRRAPRARRTPTGSTVVTADALRLDDAARPATHRARREPAVQRRRSRSCCTCSSSFRRFARVLVMVQAEVADRLAAPPGQPDLRRAVGEGRVVRRGAPGRRRRAQRVLAGAQRRLRAWSRFTRREPPATTASRGRGVRRRRRRVRPAPQDAAGRAGRAGPVRHRPGRGGAAGGRHRPAAARRGARCRRLRPAGGAPAGLGHLGLAL